MRLYRGIAVSAKTAAMVIHDIRARGLQPGVGKWTMLASDLKPRLEEIWRKPAVSMADTRTEGDAAAPSWVCACGEKEGALYYAWKHNRTTEDDTPILVTLESKVSDVVVDGRDFLYTAFQFGNPERARPVLEHVFGSAILRYANRAWASTGDERIALCDLAVQDNAVVLAHVANKTVISGRYGTRFRSAFLVRMPVPVEYIVDVRAVDDEFCLPDAEVSLQDVR